MMKRTVIFILCSVLLSCGCSTVEPKRQALTSQEAQAAVLNLMRSSMSPFEGADAARLEKITAVHKNQNKFNWGAFAIDLNKRIYVANINSYNVFRSYSGKFTVNHAGQWKAQNLTEKDAHKDLLPDE